MGKSTTSRRKFLQAMSVAGASTLAARSGEAQPPQPVGDPDPCGSLWHVPQTQSGNQLNLIVFVSDTFRHDNLECYGGREVNGRPVECPNLNRFANDCVVFEDAYPEGMPTIVIRRTLYTGRRVLPFHFYPQHDDLVQLPGWHGFFNEDVTFSETLNHSGYITALISDLPHQEKPGRNFHRGFRTVRWVRGNESDLYGTVPHRFLPLNDIAPPEYFTPHPGSWISLPWMNQYIANKKLWSKQGDSCAEIVSRETSQWLRENHGESPFYLHVECFDSHEPFDPPRAFLEKYLPDPKGYSYLMGPYSDVNLPEPVKQRIRAQYAGEVTCVDYWFGKVLETITELGLLDNSIVVFLSDHGTMQGEQNQFAKGPARLRGQVTHVPLMVRLPHKQFAGKKVPGFVQLPDVMPTLLHLMGLKPPSRVTGKNFWPLVTGETKSLRDYTVHAYEWVAAVRDKEWNCSMVWNPKHDKGSYAPQLYNLSQDPQELHNVAAKYPDVVRRLAPRIKEYMAEGLKMTAGKFHQKKNSKGIGDVYPEYLAPNATSAL